MSSTEPPVHGEPTSEGGSSESSSPARSGTEGPSAPSGSETTSAAAGTGQGEAPKNPVARTSPFSSRRWPWLVGGAAALVLALVVGALIGAGFAHHRGHGGWAQGGPGHGAHARAMGGWGEHPHGGMMGERPHRGMMGGWGEGPHDGMMGGPGRGPGAEGFAGHWGGPANGGPAPVLGAVTTVSGANLTVTPDGGAAPVTVPTTNQTSVGGAQVRALADLKAGDRVVVMLGPDKSATRIRVIPATTRGTITVLNGTTATVTEPDGLTQQVDTSGLPTQPKVGDRVAVRGTATNGILKAQQLRTFPAQ